MTAPIDIECPACSSTAGNYCISTISGQPNPKLRQRVTFHHAERVDAAFRQTVQRRDDPRALRDALREALARLEKHSPLDNEDLSFIITLREVFGI